MAKMMGRVVRLNTVKDGEVIPLLIEVKSRSIRRKVAKQVKKREKKISELLVARAEKEVKDAGVKGVRNFNEIPPKGKTRRKMAMLNHLQATKKLELVASK